MTSSALSRYWEEAIQKEENLRLSWYVRNESTIRHCAEKLSQGVSDDQASELIGYKTKMVDYKERKFRPKGVVAPHAGDEEVSEQKFVNVPGGIMRPVLADVNALIYSKGRVPYLKARCQSLPEQRYYYKETSGFEYGWQMWDCAKTMEKVRYGKSAIIKNSFYRRRAGIEQDPHWYRQPGRSSPTACNST